MFTSFLSLYVYVISIVVCLRHFYRCVKLPLVTPQCTPRQNFRNSAVNFYIFCDRIERERGREEMFYLTTHSTHFIYGYMASDIWLRTILIVRKETRCHHMVTCYWLTARVLLYAPSHRQDNTYHGLCYTSRGALAGTRNSSVGPPHEGSIRRPIAPWANALPLSYVPLVAIELKEFCGIFCNSFT